MLIISATRTSRYEAFVSVRHLEYRSGRAEDWPVWSGQVKIKRGLGAAQAARVVAEAVCAALEYAEELPVGETASVLATAARPLIPVQPPAPTGTGQAPQRPAQPPAAPACRPGFEDVALPGM